MRELLIKMFTGMMAHENSWNGSEYTRTTDECFVEACGGNVVEGGMLGLFAHWDNDVQDLAPHFGVALRRDADNKLYIDTEVPAAPSPEYYWSKGEWKAPEADPAELAEV